MWAEFRQRFNWRLVLGLLVLAGVWGLADFLAARYMAENLPEQRFRPDPVLGYTFQRTPRYPRMNQEGFRDDEVSPVPRPGEFRILCLGDSFLAGVSYPRSETLPENIERASGIAGLQAINTGVDGYALAHMVRVLRARIDRYRPSMVLAVCTMDDGQIEQPPLDSPARVALYRALYESPLCRLAALTAHGLQEFGNWPPLTPFCPDSAERAFPRNLAIMTDIARRHGVPVMVVIETQTSGDPQRPESCAYIPPDEGARRLAARTADALDIDILWLYDLLAEGRIPPGLALRDGSHLTPEGSATVARLLVAEMRKRGFIPAKP